MVPLKLLFVTNVILMISRKKSFVGAPIRNPYTSRRAIRPYIVHIKDKITIDDKNGLQVSGATTASLIL